MTEDEFGSLREGDIVRHVHGADGYIVHSNIHGGPIIAVRQICLHNSKEWLLVSRGGRVINSSNDKEVPSGRCKVSGMTTHENKCKD